MNEKKLDDLPPSYDKYWEHSEVEATKMDPVECDHEFGIIERTAYCPKCGFGLYLDDLDTVKDGHLYREGKFIL